jgi:hypothetical protein
MKKFLAQFSLVRCMRAWYFAPPGGVDDSVFDGFVDAVCLHAYRGTNIDLLVSRDRHEQTRNRAEQRGAD